MSASFNPYTKRQSMIEPDYEVYRYRSTYMNEVELHHHDFYEVYLLLRGRIEYIVENKIYRMRPGDWMLCSPLELHQAASIPMPTRTNASCCGSPDHIWTGFPPRAPA